MLTPPPSLRPPLACLLTLLTLLAFSPTALAKKDRSPASRFSGQIILSHEKFPRQFKSDGDMVKHMKRVDTKGIKSSGSGQWTFNYMVFASSILGTGTAAVTYYDITDGKKVYVNNFTLYPHDKNDRVVSGYADLSEARNFKANRKYLMIVSRAFGQKPLASSELVLLP